MKLRNKNTGEICDFVIKVNATDEVIIYETIDLMLEEWEVYKPTEPLIKDEKIRKAVRAWWETVPDVITDKRIIYKKDQNLAVGIYSIYCGTIYPKTLEVGKMYTIDELCGVEDD